MKITMSQTSVDEALLLERLSRQARFLADSMLAALLGLPPTRHRLPAKEGRRKDGAGGTGLRARWRGGRYLRCGRGRVGGRRRH